VIRRRVVQIIGRMNVGGPARLVIASAVGLREHGYETSLIVGRPEPYEGDLTTEAQAAGLEVFRVPSMTRRVQPFDDLRAFLAIHAHLRRVRPDIVHTHTAKAGTLGRIAARAAGVPSVVHTFHGHVFEGYFSPLVSTGIVWTERVLARLTDRIVAVSDAARRDIERVADPARIDTIHPGVDLAPFLDGRPAPALRESWGIPAGAVVVGLVARLVPIKQVDVFLRLAERVPVAYFVIAGDGPERSRLAALRDASAARDRIIFAGFCRDLPALYRAFDLVVLCSANEGLPVALIEAQAAGLPVVAYDVGGVLEVVHSAETGYVVPPGDEAALTAATVTLVRGAAERERFGRAGRAFMEREYDARRMIDRTATLYEGLPARA
jgi:glycosyltransferase involved in cell wall biosynthesis